MPWTVQNPPKPATNWPDAEKRACVAAANASLSDGGTDAEAIRACLGAAARVKAENSAPPRWSEEHMNDNRVVDLFMAEQVLAGEPVRLLPFLDEYWRWGEMQPPITRELAEVAVSNFENRATVGMHQTNLPLNVEHIDAAGKIGTLASMFIGDDGVYGTLDLTDKGRELLEDDTFDYLSPEIVWDLKDTKTGESVGPYFVGCAVTNYPFFGDSTAMFSREAGERLVAAGPPPEEEGSVSYNQLVTVVRGVFSALGIGPQTPGESPQETQEVDNMTEPRDGAGNELQIPEAFTARLTEMEGQIESFTQALAERDDRITTQQSVIDGQRGEITDLQATRLRERFSRQVESLSHVGAENEQLVEQLMWLHSADGTDERGHFSYWTELLSTVEQAMAQSVAFQEVGQPGHRQGGSAYSRFSALVQEVASSRNLVVSEGDANYATILMEVAEANPELYQEHIEQSR